MHIGNGKGYRMVSPKAKLGWDKTLYLVQNVTNRCLIIVLNILLKVERIDTGR